MSEKGYVCFESVKRIHCMIGNNRSKRVALWIGIALLAFMLLGDVWIANAFGWKYPNWLRPVSGFVDLIIGLVLLASSIPLLRQKGGR